MRGGFAPPPASGLVRQGAGGAALEPVAVAIIAGGLLHLQMQAGAGEGMGAGDILVEVDPQAGGFGGEDVAILPSDRIADQFLVEEVSDIRRLVL